MNVPRTRQKHRIYFVAILLSLLIVVALNDTRIVEKRRLILNRVSSEGGEYKVYKVGSDAWERIRGSYPWHLSYVGGEPIEDIRLNGATTDRDEYETVQRMFPEAIVWFKGSEPAWRGTSAVRDPVPPEDPLSLPKTSSEESDDAE